MTKRNRAPWLGALVATPALTVNVAPAAAISVGTTPTPAFAAANEYATLKSSLLAMNLDEKLAVAGDRIGTDPLVLTAGSDSQGTRGAAPRTNTDIPECHTASTASGAKTKSGHRGSAMSKALMRTNTNIPECQHAGASGLKTGAQTYNCTVQPMTGAGMSKNRTVARTFAATGMCIAPEAGTACGATKPGHQAITKATITKGTPASKRCGATPGAHQAITKGSAGQ